MVKFKTLRNEYMNIYIHLRYLYKLIRESCRKSEIILSHILFPVRGIPRMKNRANIYNYLNVFFQCYA